MRWGLTRTEHWILLALVAVVTVGVGANYYQSERSRTALHIESLEGFDEPLGADPEQVDINNASISELETIPGIGPAMAGRIIEYRNQNGSFKSIEDLINVKGIGDATFNKMKDKIRVDEKEALPSKAAKSDLTPNEEIASLQKTSSAEPTDSPEIVSASEAGKININTASSSQLEALPGIGPVYAQRIIDYRNANGPFRSINEVTKVKGIGPKTLEKMRPLAIAE